MPNAGRPSGRLAATADWFGLNRATLAVLVVIGFLGLLVLLGVSSVALAFGIYQLGHIVNLTIEKFFTK